mmetsp:Transcript_39489/g.84170  ORF Transcript_39489/g.84170 Transcript_39489/m.84170 type:complete len:80 (+) Transcript_39489:188-427(+)
MELTREFFGPRDGQAQPAPRLGIDLALSHNQLLKFEKLQSTLVQANSAGISGDASNAPTEVSMRDVWQPPRDLVAGTIG